MSEQPEGVYLLRVRVKPEETIDIGSLARRKVKGEYLYVGSAHGSGGFKRVSRHLEVAAGRRSGGHWHIDHLVEAGEVVETWLIPSEEDLECELAGILGKLFEQPIESFGSSDCNCYSHLFKFEPSRKSELIRELNEMKSESKPIRFDWK